MKIICAGDFHLPDVNNKALAVFENYLGRDKWDYLVIGGDLLDFSYLSKYSIGNLRSIEGKRIMKDYDLANKLLDKIDKLHKGKKVFIVGNHEDRVRKYIDANPNLEGFVEIDKCLKLKERGYKVVWNYPKGDLFTINGISFIHGTYHNQFHAKKHLDAYESIVYFHTHTFQQFTKSSFKKGLRMAQGVGSMCNYEQSYIGKRPSSWQLGFLTIETDKNKTIFSQIML